MKTSIRTLSDSSNEFLPTLRKRLHPLQDFLARKLRSLWPFNLKFFQSLRHSCSDNGSTSGSHKSGMNISMRTFPDSGNQSLLAFWKILDPFQGFFTGYDFFLRTLDFHLPFQCLHFLAKVHFTPDRGSSPRILCAHARAR